MIDARAAETFTRLVDIMARLRAPGGCPWDREQTPESLRPYLLEEAYEVLDAIDGGEPEALRDELGDLLLQVVFQSQLAAEAGRFTVADVARGIAEKLVRRHPHVFGDVAVRDADDVVRNWRQHQGRGAARAPARTALFAGRARALPALARAQKLGEKARHLGLDWPEPRGCPREGPRGAGELEAAIAAGDRAAIEHELGDLLLTLTSLARHLDVAAELALRSASDRFVARVRRVEAAARARGAVLAELGARGARSPVGGGQGELPGRPRDLTHPGAAWYQPPAVANHPSALKRHRQSEKRRARNQAIRTRLRHARARRPDVPSPRRTSRPRGSASSAPRRRSARRSRRASSTGTTRRAGSRACRAPSASSRRPARGRSRDLEERGVEGRLRRTRALELEVEPAEHGQGVGQIVSPARGRGSGPPATTACRAARDGVVRPPGFRSSATWSARRRLAARKATSRSGGSPSARSAAEGKRCTRQIAAREPIRQLLDAGGRAPTRPRRGRVRARSAPRSRVQRQLLDLAGEDAEVGPAALDQLLGGRCRDLGARARARGGRPTAPPHAGP